MTYDLHAQRRNAMKKAYDGLFRALSSILFEADPMGIHLDGGNSDG